MPKESDEPPPVEHVTTKMQISRGEKEEVLVDFELFQDLFVFDENGNKIRFGDVYKHQKTIVVFVRHFLDFICKEYVEDLAVIPLEYLQEADVRLVVIGPAEYKFIKSFKSLTGYHYTIYCDPERKIYSALGLRADVDFKFKSDSKHVKSGMTMGILKSVWRAMKVQEYQGDVHQQGGAFVFGPGDVVHYTHADNNPLDHSPINDLLKVAGVQPVSFEKDPRVQDL